MELLGSSLHVNGWELCLWLSFAVIIYTYAIYPAVLFLMRLALGDGRPTKEMEGDLPFVSIVLAAYNEEESVAAKLENCLSIDYPSDRYEILIGSDGSSDRTPEIISEFNDPRVKPNVFSTRRGKMAVVNDLVAKSTGEICFFSDITELLDASAIKAVVVHYSEDSVGAVTGNHIYRKDGNPISLVTRMYWAIQRAMQLGESRLYSVVACDGTIYSCRRDLFPYPSADTINDDVAVPLGILRKQKRVIYEPRAIARGEALSTTKSFLRQKVRGQAGMYQILARHLDMLRPIPVTRLCIYLSHCAMPLLASWMLLLCLVSSAVLAGESMAARVLLGIQLAGYSLAMIGWLLSRVGWRFPPASLCFYFLVANVASLFGFFAFLTGKQTGRWSKVEGGDG